MKLGTRLVFAVSIVGAALMATATPAHADTFQLTSCDISGGCGTVTNFGSVTLNFNTATGAIDFDVLLNAGNRFVETGAGGEALFLFNDTVSGSSISNISLWNNGSVVTLPGGDGEDGLTDQPAIHADGMGDFSADVKCHVEADCNGGSAPVINELKFSITGVTLAQLEAANTLDHIFVTDILCGQTGCGGGTGMVDVSSAAPTPDGGSTVALLGSALIGLALLRRRLRA